MQLQLEGEKLAQLCRIRSLFFDFFFLALLLSHLLCKHPILRVISLNRTCLRYRHPFQHFALRDDLLLRSFQHGNTFLQLVARIFLSLHLLAQSFVFQLELLSFSLQFGTLLFSPRQAKLHSLHLSP